MPEMRPWCHTHARHRCTVVSTRVGNDNRPDTHALKVLSFVCTQHVVMLMLMLSIVCTQDDVLSFLSFLLACNTNHLLHQPTTCCTNSLRPPNTPRSYNSEVSALSTPPRSRHLVLQGCDHIALPSLAGAGAGGMINGR